MEKMLQGKEQNQAYQTGDQGWEMCFRQVDDDIVKSLPEVTTPAFDAQDLGQLLYHDDERQASDKTYHD